MRVDIMTDIETLGTQSDSQIIQIAACAFDIETGEIVDTFNKCVNINFDDHINVTGNTLSWWLNTNSELLNKILTKGKEENESIESVLKAFCRFINQWQYEGSETQVYLWGNGILFDNKMIQTQMNNYGLKYPIFYRNDRDMRTLVDLASKKLDITEKELKDIFNDDTLIQHDAFDDVRYQINLTVKCYELLTKPS